MLQTRWGGGGSREESGKVFDLTTTKVNKACLNLSKCLFLVKVVYNSQMEAYLSSSFHDPFSSSHLSPVAIWMTETLMSAEKVKAVDEFGDNSEPRHVLFQMVFFFWDQEQGVL